MLCALTVRRLKPDTFDRFREAWEPRDWLPGFERAYHLRNVNDVNEIVSFGFFNGTREDFERQRRETDHDGSAEEERQRRIAEFVESTGTDALFDVIEEVKPS